MNIATLPGWKHDAGWTNENAFFTKDIPADIKAVSGFFTIADIMCNRFSVKTPNTISKAAGAAIGQSNIGIYVSIPGVTTAEALNAFLTSNETVLMYSLVDPVERPLTAAELAAYKQLHTYMPETTVTTDTGAGMLLEYVAVTQLYLENLAPTYVTEIVNQAIREGKITVAVDYNPETEEMNIIAGGV